MYHHYDRVTYELQEHRNEALREAAKQRFLRASGLYAPQLHQRLLAGMGVALVHLGTRLQQSSRTHQAGLSYRPELHGL